MLDYLDTSEEGEVILVSLEPLGPLIKRTSRTNIFQ